MMSTTNITSNNEMLEDLEFENILTVIVLSLLLIYYIIALYVLYDKYKHDLEPTKVMQISFFFGIALFIASIILCLMRNLIESFVGVCVSYHCMFFAAMSLSQDIFLMQGDIFYGVYKAEIYDEDITVERCIKACIWSKVLPALVVLAVQFCVENAFTCSQSLFEFTQQNFGTWLVACPLVLDICIVISVTCYLGKVYAKMQNPPVTHNLGNRIAPQPEESHGRHEMILNVGFLNATTTGILNDVELGLEKLKKTILCGIRVNSYLLGFIATWIPGIFFVMFNRNCKDPSECPLFYKFLPLHAASRVLSGAILPTIALYRAKYHGNL